MNPIGSEHAMMVDRILAWSIAAAPVRKCGCGCKIRSPFSTPIVSQNLTSYGPSCTITARIIPQPTTFYF